MKVTLKAARVNAGKKQQEVADFLGVSVDHVKYLETDAGSANITYEKLLALCSFYQCTPDDIFLPINYPKSEVSVTA